MDIAARLEPEPFDPALELTALTCASTAEGAAVSFVGLARDMTKSGEPLTILVLEHHSRLTLPSIERIAADAVRRFPVTCVRVVHRCGSISAGEPIVFVGAVARHRRSAFEAVDYMMDRLKTEAIFWKREESGSGSCWIEPTETDYADRSRWE